MNKGRLNEQLFNEKLFNAYNMETLNEESASNITVTLDTAIFGTDFKNWFLTNFMDKFMLIKASDADVIPEKGTINGFVFSDLANLMTSFVSAYNGNIGSNVKIVNTAESITDYVYIVLRSYGLKPTQQGDNVYQPSGSFATVVRNGVKLVFNKGYYGQVFTFSTLNVPITMTQTEGLLLDYMFHF